MSHILFDFKVTVTPRQTSVAVHHKCFCLHYTHEEFKLKTTITDHIGFVFEENSVGKSHELAAKKTCLDPDYPEKVLYTVAMTSTALLGSDINR